MITPSVATFLITLINIGILYFVLRKILFKPVTKFIEGRSKKIQDALDQSEQETKEAKALLEQYQNQLKRVEQESAALIKEAQDRASVQAESIIAAAKQEAAALIAQSSVQIEAEKRAALILFRAEAAVLVTQAAGRLVQRELNPEDSSRFAALLLQEMGTR
ncbi:ATP synthase subunit b [Spirochaetia bacterium]|nr:ATP synthase subunit b [Spirochaetia bacterium]GHU32433.1 ATP synthase subunit b [Spirochaetia bacterium]